MTAELLRISAGVVPGVAAGRRAEERGLPHARGRLGVPVSTPCARGLRPGASGSRISAEDRHLVTAEMRASLPQKVLRTSWGPLSRIDLGRPNGIDRLLDWRIA